MDSRGRVAFWIVALLAVALLLVRTPAVPLIDPDEPRFARTSLEMSRTGDLVVPTYEWNPRLVKPPLLHWIQVPLFGLLGVSELTARLPSAAATLGSLLILGWLARRRFGDEGAAWAAAFFATLPLVVASGRLGTLDALLSVHVLAAVALDMAEPEETGPYRGAAIGALLGLAFLAKGPVGLILPLLVMLAGRTAAGRGIIPARRTAIAFVGAWCVLVLPWGLALVARMGAGSVLDTLRDEVLVRYFSGTSHVKPPWFYAPVVLLGFTPWIAPLCLALVRVLRRRGDPAARSARYAAAGLLAGLLFLSLGWSKLPSYVLPLAPLAAILVTWELGQELNEPRQRTLGPTLLAASLAAFGVVLWIAAGRYLEDPAHSVALYGAAIYLAGGMAASAGVIRRRPRWVYGVAAFTAAGFLLLCVTVLMPGLMRSRSARELIKEVPELTSDRPLVVVEMQVPSLVFYLDRIPERVNAEGLAARLDRGDGALFVIDPDDLPLFDEAAHRRLQEVGRQGKYRVYESAK